MTGKATDFNDLATEAGSLDAVRQQLEQAEPTEPPPEWPDPILPGHRRVPDVPASLLPTWAGAMAGAVAESTQTPPVLSVLSVLAVLSIALQRRFEVAPHGHGYTEPLSLWTLGVSPTGTRKTAVMTALTAPLARWEKLHADRMRGEIARVNARRALGKKRVERLTQVAAKTDDTVEREKLRMEIEAEELAMPDELRAPRLFTDDVTAERLQAMLVEHHERMALVSDEAGVFANMSGLYSGGQVNIDVYLKAHSGSSFRVDRAGRLAHVDKPALAMLLLMQPDVLAEVAASRRFRASGLLGRFLYAVPVSNVGQRDVRQHTPIPADIEHDYERQLGGLLQGLPAPAGKPRVLGLSAAARELWLDLADEIERNQGDGGRLLGIADWTAKFPGAVARIATLLELAELGTEAAEVGFESMDRAVSLGRRLIPHAQAALGLLGTDETDSDAEVLVRWVQTSRIDEFTRREAQKAHEGRFRSVARLAKALERLELQDVVKSRHRYNKGAPPSKVYDVNPKVGLSRASRLS